MASPPDDASFNELRAALDRAASNRSDLAWKAPGDLSRLSRQSFIADQGLGRTIRSAGHLRFWGPRVVGNSVRLSEVGGILTTFQRAVTAVGAAIEGITTARGTLPTPIVGRTLLRLSAAPSAGSVIVSVEPEQDPHVELYPTGDVPFEDGDRPLADRSLDQLIQIVSSVEQQTGGVADLRPTLARLGPRVASAVRAFSRLVADDELNLDLAWMEPRRPTAQVTLTAISARFIEQEIARAELDTDEVTIEGVIRTLSDLRPLDIEVVGGQVWRVLPGDEPPPLADLTVGDHVRVRLSVTTEQRVGGDEVTTYTLISIERVGPDSAS